MQKLIEYKPIEMVRDRYIKLTRIRNKLKESIKSLNEFKISELDNYDRVSNLVFILNFDNGILKETINKIR